MLRKFKYFYIFNFSVSLSNSPFQNIAYKVVHRGLLTRGLKPENPVADVFLISLGVTVSLLLKISKNHPYSVGVEFSALQDWLICWPTFLKRKIVLFTDFWLRWVSVPDCGGQDSSPVATLRLLIAVASPVLVCGLQGAQASGVLAPGPQRTGSIEVTHGLSCSTACWIFLDQGSNLCLLHRQEDS